MSRIPVSLTIPGNDQAHLIALSEIQYLGHGAYSCLLNVRSNGFSCAKAFGFDNDEYFLAKLKDVLAHNTGEAEMMDLQSENFLKIQALENDSLLVSGLVMEQQPLSQSLEFAFITRRELLERFTSEFSCMVQSNT